MLVTLNLVPENEKKEIRLHNFYLAVKNLIFIFLFTIIVSATILLIAKITLNNYLIKVIEEQTTFASARGYSSEKIRKIKKDIEQIHLIQNDFIPWSVFLVKLGLLVPNGVTVGELNMQSNGNFLIVGSAKKREDILSLRDIFMKSEYFEPFDLPYNTLFERKDIKFNLTLQLLKEKTFLADPL